MLKVRTIEADEERELHANRIHHFDSSVGRWISDEPLGFAGNDGELVRYPGEKLRAWRS